ncbi:MAG TPA: Na+/H+ antiporter subunit D, partial [Rhizobium sp.]|nr:Na+/H+ antiporter subunit D [Rhizobium sp.]
PYWRADPAIAAGEHRASLSPSALLPILLLAALIIWFGLFPEPLISLSQDAAVGLIDPGNYITSVFPKEITP